MKHIPRKRFGQHFLVDKNVLQKIVDAASIKDGDHVIEIGPGLGVLTEELIRRGADVTAIEQDMRFVTYLMTTLVTMKLEVVAGDAAENDWDELLRGTPWKFVSNLPYSITSLAIRKALWSAGRIGKKPATACWSGPSFTSSTPKRKRPSLGSPPSSPILSARSPTPCGG